MSFLLFSDQSMNEVMHRLIRGGRGSMGHGSEPVP